MFHKIKAFFYFLLLSITCCKYQEEKHHITINGLDMFYVTRGPQDGKPVLLVHGNGGSHKSMRTQAMELAKRGYRVYSPDSRGQGENAALDEYHYADMAEDMYAFIQALELDKPACFGWSDGGIILLLLEREHPGTCGPMAVAGANLCPDCGEDFESFKQWILDEGTPLAMMMLNEPDIAPESLAAIKCPTLVCGGSEDLISVEHTTLIAESIPGAELEIFQGASHSSYIKKDPRMGRRFKAFLDKYGY